jgi:hypothetical protein
MEARTPRTIRCVVRIAPKKPSLAERQFVKLEDMTIAVLSTAERTPYPLMPLRWTGATDSTSAV